MAHHVLAFSNAAVPNGSVLTDITAVTDRWAPMQNNHFLLPKDSRLYAAAVVGANVNRSRIVSPTLRAVILPQIQPLNTGAAPISLMPMAKYHQNGFLIRSIDELEVDIAQGGAGAERDSALLFVGDGNFNVPPGDIYTVHGTTAITLSAGVWVSGVITLDQGLPKGRYSAVGMQAVGANLLAARLCPIDAGRCGGCLGMGSLSIIPDQIFRLGHLGEFCQFEHTAMPTVECLGIGAGASQDIWLDLIKVN